MSSEMNALTALLADETKAVADRRNAAIHLVCLRVEAVPEPSAHDPEVLELRKPWTDPALAQEWTEITKGRSVNGWTSKDAIAEVHKRHRLRVLLGIVVDQPGHSLMRLAAADAVLTDHIPSKHSFKINGRTSPWLLDNIRPADGFKWTDQGKQPVCRPPMDLQDVWE